MNLANVNVNFSANTSGFSSGITSMQSLVRAFSSSAPALIAGVGVAIAGVAVVMGVQAVKAAADFQQGLNRLITGAGDTTDNMNKMGLAIRGISTETGVLTGELLPAMYQIISAGQRGAQAENTLAVAAKGSIVEQAKIVDVAKAITTVMTDYANKHFTATQAMNGLTRATQLGKLTLEQLSTALSPILSTSANLGIHFSDLAAAMSTMTNAGIPAERAATSLRFLMQSLENPTKKATTAMQEMGLNTVAVGNELKVSLPGALQMIYDAAKKAGPEGSVPFNRAMSDMIGGQRSLQAMLSLTGGHFSTFKDDAAKIAAAMNVSKTAVLGWDVAQTTFNVQLDKAKASFQGLLITVGQMLLPVLTQLLAQVTPLIGSFTDWLSNSDNLKVGLQTLSDIMAPFISACQDVYKQVQPLVQQLLEWAIKNDVAGKALAALKIGVQFLSDALRFMVPIIISVIQALIAFGVSLWQTIGPPLLVVVDFIKTHWAEISSYLKGTWDIIVGVVKVAWSIVSGIILVGLDLLSGNWKKAWEDLKKMFAGIWDGLKQAALGGVREILSVLAMIPGGIGDLAKLALKALNKMTGDMNTSMEQWKQAALGHSIQMQQGVVDNLKKMAAGIETQMKNAKTEAEKQALAQQLAVINAAIATNTGVLKQYQAMAGNVASVMSGMTGTVSSKADQMKQQFVQRMREMQDQVVGHSIIPDMAARIVAVINGINLFQSGLHMVQQFAAGILAGINAAIAAATAVANAVAKVLKHSKPEEGPLRDDDVWGLHMAQNFARGLRAGMGEVQAAMSDMLGGSMGSIGVSHSFSGAPAFGGGMGAAPVIHNHIYVQSPDVYMDTRKVVQAIGPELAYSLRFQNHARRPT